MGRLLATALAVLTFAFLGGIALAGGSGTGTYKCGDDSGEHKLTWTPTTLWPPNHKMQPIALTYSDSDSNHQLTLTITGATTDDSDTGAGNPALADWSADPDTSKPMAASGKKSVTAWIDLRGERSGMGSGRTYTIQYAATSMGPNGMDNDCSNGPVTVSIPHDCRNGACRGIPRP